MELIEGIELFRAYNEPNKRNRNTQRKRSSTVTTIIIIMTISRCYDLGNDNWVYSLNGRFFQNKNKQ
jgi:hypothetical protein